MQYLLGKQRRQLTDTIPSDNKKAQAATTTTKTKIANYILIKQADRAFGTDYCLRFSFVILLS
jgi:hypothetical protein